MTTHAAVWLREAVQASREVGERLQAWATLTCTGLAAVRCGDLAGDDRLSNAGRNLATACSLSAESPAPGFIERRLADRVLGSRPPSASTGGGLRSARSMP